MNMCDQQSQHAKALITAQNHGTILVMVAWFLACILALCTAARIISRCRSNRLRYLPLSDDAIIATASLCALGSTVTISTAVDSGLGKRACLLTRSDMEAVQIKVFISTLLFVTAITISKCSMLLFLHQIADSTLQKVGVVIIGVLMFFWTAAVMAGIVFQCGMPKPWEIWTGRCIPLLPFWVTVTVVDIVIDISLVFLSAHTVWTLHIEYRQKTLATLIFSLRWFLVTASVVRIFYLQRAFSGEADPTFDFIPYAITTQCHSTVAVMLACSPILTPLTSLLHTTRSPLQKPKSRQSKHWSGSTIGGTPYESYDSFATNSRIIKEPLPSIQASMSTPTSLAASRNSLSRHDDILLPEILLPTRFTKAPPRPPPPTDEERPDLSMFTKKTMMREPPLVTRLGNVRDMKRGETWEKVGKERSLKARGLA